jgi:1-acyl-sn-glycerol-3-phosphate acyltransferase
VTWPELRPVPLPERNLERIRRLASLWIDRSWKVGLHGAENVPESGPVILAANHIGWLDGPLLILKTPRPTHALAKRELYEGRMGRFLTATAQIPVSRTGTDAGALRTAAESLLAGQAVAIYPEGRRGAGDLKRIKGGVAWLALVTGAPIVPVTIFGTRPAGAGKDARPDKGAPLDVVFGQPLTLDPVEWPRTAAVIAATTKRIGEHLRGALSDAQELTGRELPGPLPKAVAS